MAGQDQPSEFQRIICKGRLVRVKRQHFLVWTNIWMEVKNIEDSNLHFTIADMTEAYERYVENMGQEYYYPIPSFNDHPSTIARLTNET